jgi:hypothetical protein
MTKEKEIKRNSMTYNHTIIATWGFEIYITSCIITTGLFQTSLSYVGQMIV